MKLDPARKIGDGMPARETWHGERVVRLLLLSALLAFGATGTYAESAQSLAITYYHYPPKLRAEAGTAAGPYADKLNEIGKTAGLNLEWLASTINEEARMLDDGRRSFCTTGRFYTPERAERWTFLPYLFDTIPADVVVARRDMEAALRAHGDMGAVVRDSAIIGTVLGSGIYGDTIDPVIRSAPAWIYRDGKTDFQLINMVLAGRAQYAIVPEDQWAEAAADNPALEKSLVMIDNLGTLPRTPLYLVCSHGVDPQVIAALESAMATLGFQHLKPGS